MKNLTSQETNAIKSLQRLAKRWPHSLWLFSGAGTLWVMRKKEGQKVVNRTGAFDADYATAQIDIENDGGDW